MNFNCKILNLSLHGEKQSTVIRMYTVNIQNQSLTICVCVSVSVHVFIALVCVCLLNQTE